MAGHKVLFSEFSSPLAASASRAKLDYMARHGVVLGVMIITLLPFGWGAAESGRRWAGIAKSDGGSGGTIPVPAGDIVRVATWNVASAQDAEALAAEITASPALASANVLLLQEVERYPAEDVPRQLAHLLGVHYAYAPARAVGAGTHGLAMLSRAALTDVDTIPLERFDLKYHSRTRIAQAATVDLGGHSVRVYNVHLDTRLRASDRRRQLAPVVFRALSESSPSIIGGDFNTINAISIFLPVVPVPFPGAGQASMLDAFMVGKGFSTPFTAVGGTGPLGMRLDAMFARGMTVAAWGREKSSAISDHVPLWMDVTVGDDLETPPAID